MEKDRVQAVSVKKEAGLPKISIITCFLNEEKFLKEAIDSVLKQHYQNWELLLVDDGSSDRSTKMAKVFAEDHSRILYLEHDEHKNKGLSASRNLGIRNSTGEILAFLDGDDVWLPKFLGTAIKTLQKHDVAMYCEATNYWRSWNKGDTEDQVLHVGAEGEVSYTSPALMMELYPLGKGAAPCLCGVLVRKNILVRHGCFDESFKGMYEDQVFLCKIYLHETVYISTNCNNLYRQREGSLVNNSHALGTYKRDRNFFLLWLEGYLKENAKDKLEVNRKLQKALFPFRYPKIHFLKSLSLKIKRRLKGK
jgi:glycosyltransferase involved in cell wall biosynthesis